MTEASLQQAFLQRKGAMVENKVAQANRMVEADKEKTEEEMYEQAAVRIRSQHTGEVQV
jgi:hypothetical protein